MGITFVPSSRQPLLFREDGLQSANRKYPNGFLGDQAAISRRGILASIVLGPTPVCPREHHLTPL